MRSGREREKPIFGFKFLRPIGGWQRAPRDFWTRISRCDPKKADRKTFQGKARKVGMKNFFSFLERSFKSFLFGLAQEKSIKTVEHLNAHYWQHAGFRWLSIRFARPTFGAHLGTGATN